MMAVNQIFAREERMSHRNPDKPPPVRVDIRIFIPMLGILLAPFIGLLFSPNLALGILIVSLSVVGWMTWNLAQQAPTQQVRTLRIGAGMNAVMAVAALLLLLIRL